MIKKYLSLILMMMICASYAQIYKWTDNQGIVHFSDSPHTGAEKVMDPEAQSFSPKPPPITSVPTPPVTNGTNASADDSEEREYTSLGILQPKDQATIRNNQGYLLVSVQVEPKLFKDDMLQILFDDKVVGKPQNGLTFQLNGIYRGSHTIAVQLLDAKGKVLKTTPTVTVFMQRPRVGMGKNAP